uniref:Uncharacterized protein n=1 Tax=Arundo donax TaxID=35708 RepID=A0A0A9D9W5_ARUDO
MFLHQMTMSSRKFSSRGLRTSCHLPDVDHFAISVDCISARTAPSLSGSCCLLYTGWFLRWCCSMLTCLFVIKMLNNSRGWH